MPRFTHISAEEIAAKNKKRILKWVCFGLVATLSLKILGYFTLSESLAITRVLKVLIRLLSTGGLGLIYLLLINRGYTPSFKFRNSLAPLLYFAYLFMGLISLLWSSDQVYTTLQLFMTGETIIYVYWFLCIYQIVKHHFGDESIHLSKLFSGAIFPIIFGFIIGMYVNPDKFFRLTHGGEVARLGGFMMNPNELGLLCVVGIGTALQDWNKRKLLWSAFITGMMIYGLLLTSSRSSLGSLAVVMMLLTLRSDKLWLKIAFIVGGVFIAPVLVNKIILKQGDLQEVLSMTGRIPFWTALLTEGLVKSPWLGFGFMRIAEGDYFISVHSYAARMTHNTFVQVLMNLGFVGATIVVLQMAATLRGWITSSSKYHKLFFIIVLIPIFLNSLTEFGIFGENNFGILFYQFLIALFVIEYQPLKSIRQQLVSANRMRAYQMV